MIGSMALLADLIVRSRDRMMSDTLTATERDRAGGRPEARPARRDPSDRFGWSAIAAMTLGVAATWLPSAVNLPLGDNHSGRVDGRYALHVRNLFEKGLSVRTSAPTGRRTVDSLTRTGRRCATRSPPWPVCCPAKAVEAWLGTYAIALLAIPAAAALLRAFGVRWIPTLSPSPSWWRRPSSGCTPTRSSTSAHPADLRGRGPHPSRPRPAALAAGGRRRSSRCSPPWHVAGHRLRRAAVAVADRHAGAGWTGSCSGSARRPPSAWC